MKCRYLVNQDSVVVTADGQRKLWLLSEPDGQKALGLIKENSSDSDQKLYDLVMGRAKAVKKYDGFSCEEDVVFVDGEALPEALGRRLVEYAEAKLPCESLLAFWDRLKKNPSEESRKDLFGFLEANEVTLTEDGYFIAYKKVLANMKDIHSGKFDNSVGKIVEMDRDEVDDDRTRTCSSGLHVCAWSYLSHFGSGSSSTDVIIEVKVDPADVVSVPIDYNNSKMRTSRYEVLSVSQGTPRTDLVCSPRGEVVSYANQEEWDAESDESDDSGCFCLNGDCCDCDEYADDCDCEDEDFYEEDDELCPDCAEFIEDCECDLIDDDTCSDPECPCHSEDAESDDSDFDEPTKPENNGFLGWKKWFGLTGN